VLAVASALLLGAGSAVGGAVGGVVGDVGGDAGGGVVGDSVVGGVSIGAGLTTVAATATATTGWREQRREHKRTQLTSATPSPPHYRRRRFVVSGTHQSSMRRLNRASMKRSSMWLLNEKISTIKMKTSNNPSIAGIGLKMVSNSTSSYSLSD
jgi:hypothetical protein